MITKHYQLARAIAKNIYGEADRVKLNRKKFTDEMASQYIHGMIEACLMFIFEQKREPFKTVEDYDAHVQYVYTKLINQLRVDFMKTEMISTATIENVIDDFANIEVREENGELLWIDKSRQFAQRLSKV